MSKNICCFNFEVSLVEGGIGSLEILSGSYIKPQHRIIGKKFAVTLAVLSGLPGFALNPVLKAASLHSQENLNLSDRT